jgi:uncharacterized Ntn-hydrolase superfamily protein
MKKYPSDEINERTSAIIAKLRRERTDELVRMTVRMMRAGGCSAESTEAKPSIAKALSEEELTRLIEKIARDTIKNIVDPVAEAERREFTSAASLISRMVAEAGVDDYRKMREAMDEDAIRKFIRDIARIAVLAVAAPELLDVLREAK